MWMKDTDGLVATLLGPCEVSADLDTRKVTILEETNYPFEDNIRFAIQTDVAGEFTIKVIKPVWAKEIKASIPYEEKNGYLVFRKFWKTNDSFELTYEKLQKEQMAKNGDIYYDYGPLVLCRKLDAVQTVTKKFGMNSLQESIYKTLDTVVLIYTGGSGSTLTLTNKRPYSIPNLFVTGMVNPITGKGEEVSLVPMFHTILRQVTFKNGLQP
jgi:DUF1680 family protein